MQLHLGEFDGNNATALLRWCLSPKEIQQLKEFRQQPSIIISIMTVAENGVLEKEENRLIRPLADQAAYIAFRNAGPHLILAGILDRNFSGPGETHYLKAIYKRHSGYNYYKQTLAYSYWDHETNTANTALDNDYLFKKIQTRLEVEVAADLFAPIPCDYKLVNYWFHHKPIDQCHNRKRRLGAYALTVTLLPLFYLLRLLFNVVLLNGIIGHRHINWQWFIHPFNNEFEIAPSDQYNRWFQTAHNHDKSIWQVLANWRSIILISLTTIGFISWILPLLFNNGSTVLVGGAIVLALTIVAGVLKRYNKAIRRIMRDWEKADRADDAKQLELDLRALSCQLMPKDLSLDTLPPEKRTIKLRFYRLKSKVCRPFAGS